MTPQALDIIAVWILLGFGLGFLSTLYGACRQSYRIHWGLDHFFDWLWFVLAAIGYVGVSFWTEWGTFRIWSIVLILTGYGVWSWLAAPLVFTLVSAMTYGQARLVYYATLPGQRLWKRVRRWPWRQRKLPPKA
ncbi:MAG: hypothetical protein C7B45_10155 [Sulfobacillus acidophilus]|uniref:Spore cortex biosynthesis protein YabQ n=1 Tax=Sulfobacillus acidophilus TaxID=53633 RepID=A0A2T2WH48_9FIRM|nr:MAG: hypothetical protein C7B45_10155 [Sulfobacillus acidophilus]